MIDTFLKQLELEETERLNQDIELIASENYPSQDILNLMGSHFSVKYAEGYPKEISKQGRHYAGCNIIDKLEKYTIEKAKMLFNVNFACVQPHSGSQANQSVYAGLLKPGDTVLGMGIEYGGHLTHFSKASSTGNIYNATYYGLDKDEKINYIEIKNKLYEFQPRLIVVGASAYPGRIDFQKIREIVNEYNNKIYEECIQTNAEVADELFKNKKCYIMADMAHFAGFIAAHVWEDKYDPTKWSDVVTTTTHKTLRGPRGGIILWNDEKLSNKLNNGCFPKTQGGPNEAVIAAKAQCFIEAMTDEYKYYMENVYNNMQALIKGVKAFDKENKLRFVMGGSENHLALIDLKGTGLLGSEAEEILKFYNIICNKNMIAGDIKPSECTGIRIGTAAITTRGFNTDMCYKLGELIAKILLTKSLHAKNENIDLEEAIIKKELQDMVNSKGKFY